MPPAMAQARASRTSRLRKYRQPLATKSIVIADPAASVLEPAPQPLGFESLAALGRRRPGLFPRRGHGGSLADQPDQAFPRRLAIAQLTSGTRGHDPKPAFAIDPRAEPVENSLSLGVVDGRALDDVPADLDPGGGLVHVLTPRAAGPAGAELEFVVGDLHHERQR